MAESNNIQETHFSDYVDILKKQKTIIITFFLVVVISVTVISILMPPVYRSTVTLLIDQEGSNILTTTNQVSIGTPDYYAYKEYFQSQAEIIQSRSIAKEVFDEFNLGKTPMYYRSKDPVEKFMKTIKVEPIRDTRLLQLHVENKKPKLAADIANRIAQIYVQRNLEYISKSEVAELLKNEYLRLQAKLRELSKVYKDKHPKIIRIKEEINDMISKIKEEKNLAPNAIPEISENVLYGLKANNVSVQDWAEPSVKPIRPKKRLNVLLAMIVGLIGGGSLAFFIEYLDDSVKSAEDTQKIVPWTFLGYILRIDTSLGVNRDLFVNYKPKDPIAEAYRTIRTSISFLSTEEHPIKKVLITSPRPREGKSVTASNLAIVFAQNESKVLIIDADMRKSRLHNSFKVKGKQGIANFLANQASFKDIIYKTEIPNLSLCPCGPHPPNPSELLNSRKMKEFLSQAEQEFDFIIFDTPPISIVTDAIIVSRVVDQTIIVLESEATSTRILPRISQLLKDAKTQNVGFIINKKAPSQKRRYDYYYAAYGADT